MRLRVDLLLVLGLGLGLLLWFGLELGLVSELVLAFCLGLG